MDLQTRSYLRMRDAERRISDLEKSIRRRSRWELRSSGAAATSDAFKITLTAQAGPSVDYDVTVWPGYINQMVPTNLVGITTTYVKDSTVYVKIDCTSDGHQITAAAILIDAVAPVLVDTIIAVAPATYTVLLGIITNNTLYQLWTGNISASPTQMIVTERASPSPGESIYDRWWNWTITEVT